MQLWTVPLHLRPLATSLMIIIHHLLGDVPSPAIFGLVLDVMEDHMDKSENAAYRVAIFIASIFLLIAGLVFYSGVSVAKVSTDYREHNPDTQQEEGANESVLLLPSQSNDPETHQD